MPLSPLLARAANVIELLQCTSPVMADCVAKVTAEKLLNRNTQQSNRAAVAKCPRYLLTDPRQSDILRPALARKEI